MKKVIFFNIAILLLAYAVNCQMVGITGTLRCINRGESSTKGAVGVVVAPGFVPAKSVITVSDPAGYFELKTGVRLSKLIDKQVSLYAISNCMNCKQNVYRVFIDHSNINIGTWKLDSTCSSIELTRHKADSLLLITQKMDPLDLEKAAGTSALLGSTAFLNLITEIATVAGLVQNDGTFPATSIGKGKIKYGQFLHSSAMFHTANIGFNFSPSRDVSEAVFWNSAAIVNSHKENNISLFTNLKNQGKLQGYKKMNDRLSVGAGVIYTQQDEFRRVNFTNNIRVDSFSMKLKEYAFLISSSILINENLGLGLSIKSMHQKFNIPKEFIITNDGVLRNEQISNTIKKNSIDFDISLNYKIQDLQVGINAMNILGSELYADAFVPGADTLQRQKQRAIGIGLTYKLKRLNIGADALFNNDGFYDIAFGLNYVPFNNGLISLGITAKQLSYSAAFRVKHFRIAYVDDNEFFVNEKRKGKINILNGRLYGGFVMDL